MTNPTHDDPQLARALQQVENCRELLGRLERIFRLPRRYITVDLSYPFRALAASNHQLAVAFNMLAEVREPAPEEPKAETSAHPVENFVVDEGRELINRIRD